MRQETNDYESGIAVEKKCWIVFRHGCCGGVSYIGVCSAYLGIGIFCESARDATAPKIILRPFNSEPGKSVKVTGLRFTAGSTVTITFNGITVDSKVPVNSTGGFVTSFIVPKGTAVGSYPVVATDAKGLQATNTLMIGTAAKIVLTTGGKPRIVGTMLTVTGTGFLPSVTVTVYFSGVAEATPTSSTTGGFVTTFAVPAVPQGSQEVSASDGTNNAQRAFIVNPHITASPTTAAPADDNHRHWYGIRRR